MAEFKRCNRHPGVLTDGRLRLLTAGQTKPTLTGVGTAIKGVLSTSITKSKLLPLSGRVNRKIYRVETAMQFPKFF